MTNQHMSEKDLLKTAAEAIGLSLSSDWDCAVEGIFVDRGDGGHLRWNPLADDGEALRLAARAGLMVDLAGTRAVASHGHSELAAFTRDLADTDVSAAARLAIVHGVVELYNKRKRQQAFGAMR